MRGISHNGYKNWQGKHEAVFSEEEKDLLVRATRIVELLPELQPDGELIRCHEVARVVGCLLKLDVQDGKYGLHDHSWCWTGPFHPRWPRTVDPPKILDPYCVGNLPVVRLLDSASSVPHLGWMYRPAPERDDVLKAFVESEAERIRRILQWP